MREIDVRFRAWDKKNKKMVNVRQINWNDRGEIEYINGDEASNFVLMQYTGLKDKNGREIYEGDIVKWQSVYVGVYVTEVGVVDFQHGCFGIKYKSHNGTNVFWSFTGKEDLEVIGNIYESPELIEK